MNDQTMAQGAQTDRATGVDLYGRIVGPAAATAALGLDPAGYPGPDSGEAIARDMPIDEVWPDEDGDRPPDSTSPDYTRPPGPSGPRRA